MTQSDPLWTSDDEVIRDLLEPIRDLDVPPGLEATCLAAALDGSLMAEKLQTHRSGGGATAWVRYSIAIAASLLIGLGLGWFARGQGATEATKISGEPLLTKSVPESETRPPDFQIPFATSLVEYQEGDIERSFFTEEIYLCGVGRIQSKSEYRIVGESK